MAKAFSLCWFNNNLKPLNEAHVSPLDRGWLFGDGVYEVIPAYEGQAFRCAAHLQRLQRNLDALSIRNPWPLGEWDRRLSTLMKANKATNCTIYIQITRGAASGRDFLPPDGITPTLFVMAQPLIAPSPDILKKGISAATLADIRWHRCDIKSISLLGAVMLRQEAYRRGADEAILLRDEHLAEGSSSSIFGYRDHTAIAPPQSTEILPSITRQVVEELLNETGVPLNQSAMSIDELYGCEEIWVASSAREILPITRIDNRQVGTGQPGPVWATLYRAFQEAKKRHPRRDNQI